MKKNYYHNNVGKWRYDLLLFLARFSPFFLGKQHTEEEEERKMARYPIHSFRVTIHRYGGISAN